MLAGADRSTAARGVALSLGASTLFATMYYYTSLLLGLGFREFFVQLPDFPAQIRALLFQIGTVQAVTTPQADLLGQ